MPWVPPGKTSFCVDKGYKIDFIDTNYHVNMGISRAGPNNALMLNPKENWIPTTEGYCNVISSGVRVW